MANIHTRNRLIFKANKKIMKKVCTLENSVYIFAAVTNKTNKQWIYQAHTMMRNAFAHQQTNSKTAH